MSPYLIDITVHGTLYIIGGWKLRHQGIIVEEIRPRLLQIETMLAHLELLSLNKLFSMTETKT